MRPGWRYLVGVFLLASLLAAHPPAAWGQATEELQALRRAIEALKEGQQRLERRLEEIRGLLRERQPAAPPEIPSRVRLSLSDAPRKGSATAKLLLVDFTDYQ